MKFEFSRRIFEKNSNIKFHENPSIGSQIVPFWQTDMTKVKVAFRNFANASKNPSQISYFGSHQADLLFVHNYIYMRMYSLKMA